MFPTTAKRIMTLNLKHDAPLAMTSARAGDKPNE